MSRLPQVPDIDDERMDAHNTSIDEGAAAAGRCGMIHLPSGRTCQAQAGHADGCDFVPVP